MMARGKKVDRFLLDLSLTLSSEVMSQSDIVVYSREGKRYKTIAT